MKAWAFYRRSTDKQELSIEDQRQECRAFAVARGWEIVREFEPAKGFGSGLTIDRDPVFKEMIRLAELGNHGIQNLIVYDVSRFGRQAPEDKIYWEQHFKRNGVQLMYVKDDFKNDGSIGDVLSKVVKNSEAHEYSRKLSQVTLRGSISHSALGHSVGGPPPYGYDRLLLDRMGQPSHVIHMGESAPEGQHVIWTPCSGEADNVRWIFENYDKGIGFTRLTEMINARGVPPPSANRHHLKALHWGKSTIRNILKNPVYIGQRVYNRTNCKSWRRGSGGPFKKPSAEWVIKENAHEPIIPRELFDRIQATFQKRVFGIGRSYARPYLLTGLTKCGHCGYSLTGSVHDKYRRYGCSGYHRIGTSICRNYYLLADEMESLAVNAIRSQIKNPAWTAEVRHTLEGMVKGEFQNPLAHEIEERRQQLQEISRQIENIVQAIQKTGFSEALEISLRSLEAQRDGLRKNLQQIESKIRAMTGSGRVQDRVFELVDEFDVMWEKAPIDEKKLMLKDFLYGVSVDPDGDEFRATYHVWTIPGLGKEIAPFPAFAGNAGRHLSLKSIAGVRPALNGLMFPVPTEIRQFVTTQSYVLSRHYGHRKAAGTCAVLEKGQS